jgi:hypothetical protein
MVRRLRLVPVLAVALVGFCALAPAFAADAEKSAASEPSKEDRAEMAAIHEKMAECLRSERPFSECRSEMRKSCHDRMGGRACPMMSDDGGAGHGHGMGPGMRHGGPPAETPKP